MYLLLIYCQNCRSSIKAVSSDPYVTYSIFNLSFTDSNGALQMKIYIYRPIYKAIKHIGHMKVVIER